MASDFWVVSGEDLSLLWLQIFESCPERIFHCYGFSSASEIVRAGLRVLEDQEAKLLNLRNMLIQGEQSGVAEYSYESLLTDLDKDNH